MVMQTTSLCRHRGVAILAEKKKEHQQLTGCESFQQVIEGHVRNRQVYKGCGAYRGGLTPRKLAHHIIAQRPSGQPAREGRERKDAQPHVSRCGESGSTTSVHLRGHQQQNERSHRRNDSDRKLDRRWGSLCTRKRPRMDIRR